MRKGLPSGPGGSSAPTSANGTRMPGTPEYQALLAGGFAAILAACLLGVVIFAFLLRGGSGPPSLRSMWLLVLISVSSVLTVYIIEDS